VTKPEVGVVVPSHTSRYLPYALLSLTAQTVETEVVVVDDGSPDREVSRLAREFGFRFVRNASSEGPPTARNVGVDALHQPWIVNLDADNIAAPRFAEELLRTAKRGRKIGIAYSRAIQFGEATGPYEPVMRRLPEHLGRANFIDASSMFAREAWREAGGWDPDAFPYSDWDFWLSIVERGWRLGFEPRYLLAYRVRSSGILRSTARQEFERAQRYIRRKHHRYLTEHDPDRFRYVIPRAICYVQRQLDAQNAPDASMIQATPVVIVGTSSRSLRQDLLDTLSELRMKVVSFVDVPSDTTSPDVCGFAGSGLPKRMFAAFRMGARAAVVSRIDGPDRERLAGLVEEAGFLLPILRHPRSRVSSTAHLGAGTLVADNARVGAGAHIGRLVDISSNALVKPYAKVLDCVSLSRAAEVGERATICRYADVGEYAKICTDVVVGERARIPAGAVVTQDVGPGWTSVGRKDFP
jgi:acetyltransferase-like isoleucine patch superfamily enzyme/GT2 family glycosyltransferase